MAEFLTVLFCLSAGGSLMVLLLLSLRYIIARNMPSTVYYYLWLLVLLRFVLPVPGLFSAPQSQAQPLSYSQTQVQQSGAEGFDRVYARPGIFENNARPQSPMPEKEQGEQPAVVRTERTWSVLRLQWDKLLFGLWLLGALVSLLCYITGYLRFSRLILKHSSKPTSQERRCYRAVQPGPKPELIRCSIVSTPMLMGLFHPVLVLPEGSFSPSELENIFLHELSHYSRRDILYKWFTLPVLGLHWFNPLVYIVRREINRACELSCDERLIRKMSRAQKQSYGDTLIALASSGRIPAGVVATTFTTEKEYLKERLVKIMKFRENKAKAVLSLVLSALLLVGCAAVTGPSAGKSDSVSELSPEQAAEASAAMTANEDGSVNVSTVDQLLAAIAPDTVIYLEPGLYDLAQSADYGQPTNGKPYTWEQVYDGFELVIRDIKGLEIKGGDGLTLISAEPRYANVIKLLNCSEISLEALTVGHSEKQGYCSGGVLYLDSCNDVRIDACKLYGCGTIGIYTENCKNIYASESSVYECSFNAVYSVASHDVRLENCQFHDCSENMVQSVFTVDSCMGFAVVNSEIYANNALHLIDSRYSQQVSLLGCDFDENVFTEAMFWCEGYSVTVDKCYFSDMNHFSYYYDSGDGQIKQPPVNAQGEALSLEELFAMEREESEYSGPQQAEPVELDETVDENGLRHIKAADVDEFLAAIADNTVIELTGELYDLSTAADYGAFGSENYYWFNVYDGPGLVISGVENLHIVGNGAVISAIPRYANVLGFVNCRGITLEGFTAGHTQEPGSCAGGVLDFANCEEVDVLSCRLYGCGIFGISASGCRELCVEKTEIYECSQGAIFLYSTENASFADCDIHDCYSPEISISDCTGVSYDGEQLNYGMFKIENGKPVVFEW